MSRKVVALSSEHLVALSAPCRSCLFWELDPVRRARVEPGDALQEKQDWLRRVQREWGECGRVVLVNDEPVGYLTYAPESFVPAASGFPTAPVSPDAVVLTMTYVDPGHARGGLGRVLVQAMARDLVQRGDVRAIEAFGDLRGPGRPEDPARRCLVPVDFLTSVGFLVHRPHVSTPRLRMDLRTTVPWRSEVEAALERLVGVVRPAPSPARMQQGPRHHR